MSNERSSRDDVALAALPSPLSEGDRPHSCAVERPAAASPAPVGTSVQALVARLDAVARERQACVQRLEAGTTDRTAVARALLAVVAQTEDTLGTLAALLSGRDEMPQGGGRCRTARPRVAAGTERPGRASARLRSRAGSTRWA